MIQFQHMHHELMQQHDSLEKLVHGKPCFRGYLSDVTVDPMKVDLVYNEAETEQNPSQKKKRRIVVRPLSVPLLGKRNCTEIHDALQSLPLPLLQITIDYLFELPFGYAVAICDLSLAKAKSWTHCGFRPPRAPTPNPRRLHDCIQRSKNDSQSPDVSSLSYPADCRILSDFLTRGDIDASELRAAGAFAYSFVYSHMLTSYDSSVEASLGSSGETTTSGAGGSRGAVTQTKWLVVFEKGVCITKSQDMFFLTLDNVAKSELFIHSQMIPFYSFECISPKPKTKKGTFLEPI